MELFPGTGGVQHQPASRLDSSTSQHRGSWERRSEALSLLCSDHGTHRTVAEPFWIPREAKQMPPQLLIETFSSHFLLLKSLQFQVLRDLRPEAPKKC